VNVWFLPMGKIKNEHLLPVEIWRIYPHPDVTPPESFLVVLKGEEDRYVPISIGHPEGQYLVMAMQHVSFPRPLTHNLLQNLLDRVKGKVNQLVIHTLKRETFHAYLLIQTQDKVFYLDCRPSDGMILATLMSIPMFMSPEVMDEAGRELSGMLNIADLGEELLGGADGEGGMEEEAEFPDDSPVLDEGAVPEAEDADDGVSNLQNLMELQMSKDGALLPTAEIAMSGPPDGPPPTRIEALRAQLDRLVAEEAYEDAARIRDQISSIEESGESD
jgi:bifunctional DNase/RNase